MSACPQCGTVAKPNDKFCNTCGAPVVARQSAPQQPAYGAPAPAPYGGGGGYGGGAAYPPPSRCQMGHDIAPGQSYCAQGHPIALDAMQFSNDQYGQPQQGYGAQPYASPAQPYAPTQQPVYGAPQAGPPPYQGMGPGPQGGPPPQAGGFPPAAPPPNMYGPTFEPGPPPGAPPAAASAQATALPANALRGFIVTYQSNTKGDFWPLHGGRVTVGRSSSGDQVDVPLADATISSRHALIVVDGTNGTVTVEDTGSTNGTYVNEEHLGFNGRRELRDGDRVRFGGFTTIVKLIGRI